MAVLLSDRPAVAGRFSFRGLVSSLLLQKLRERQTKTARSASENKSFGRSIYLELNLSRKNHL
jgi:alpha/beta superfamily hydrolase